MEKLKIKRPLTRFSYLDTLLQEFDVSLLEADNYFSNNHEKLSGLSRILNSNAEEDTQKCLALLHILTHGASYRMIKKYCHRNNKQYILNDPDNDLLGQMVQYTEKYKLPLLSALLYDDAFFDEVREWYEMINSGLGEKTRNNKIPHKNKSPYFIKSLSIKKEAAIAMADDSPELKHYFSYYVDDIIYGKLSFYVNEQNQLMQVCFSFMDKETKKYAETIPFYLDVEIILNSETGPRIISLDREMKSEPSTICSEIKHINWLKGFEVSKIGETGALTSKGET